MAVFEDLNGLNVNEHSEKKKVGNQELTYLSWPWAWAEVKKRYPEAHYEIWRNAEGLPYSVDPMTGYMVYTSVTIDGITHEMWLPVMNGANKAMKPAAYKYKAGSYEKEVEAATMTDINKTIMRCLVKNLAMFGLGLYIYAGEDLPEAEQEEQRQSQQVPAADVRPANAQSGPVSASVSTVAAIPQAAPQAAKPAEIPQETKPETPGAYLKRRIMEMTTAYREYGFNFAETRQALIASGQLPDVPSATMTMEQAAELMRHIEGFYEDRKAAAQDKKVG